MFVNVKPLFGTRLACSLALAIGGAWAVEQPGSANESAGATNRHWSFIAPTRPPLPKVRNLRWVRNPIDYFVLARLEKEKVRPSPEADRVTLIRRLSFDLTGLPPKLEEVRAFVQETDPGAYERLVDRLLASPHYGEHWGRHWLDLARYADSDGYEKDGVRPYAYLYRDWVIHALNRDVPFDQFTIEQLAGDLLPDASEEQKIATGFHRQTLTNKEGGVDPEEFRCKAVVDRVNTTAAVWLGLTLACAECHNHKYDRISQREFYEFYAFFNSASEKDLPAPTPDELDRYGEAKRTWAKEQARLQSAADAYLSNGFPAALTNWEESARAQIAANSSSTESGGSVSTNEPPGSIQTVLKLPADQRSEPQQAELAKYFREQVDPRARKLDRQRAAHAKKEPRFPQTKAATLAEDSEPRETRVHMRGDFLREGEAVQPGTIQVLHRFGARRGGRPDRLDLARWLVDPANPLTARVTVNRVWQHLFGRGLVTTLDDFGTRGEPPSHPELLDWLAVTFMSLPQEAEGRAAASALGWSQKALIRLIVTSATYRQSSRYRPDLQECDPGNAWLARQGRFRLDAENVRDAYLAVSGLLNPTIGGPSVRPPLPADIAAIGYADSIKWKESQGPDKYRRGLYIFFQRTVPYPMLTTFDAPDSNVTCARRERSNTPLQALTLLNDPTFFECAQVLGRKLAAEPGVRPGKRIRRAFEICLSRPPTAEELARLERFYHDQQRLLQTNVQSALKLTGGPFPPSGGEGRERGRLQGQGSKPPVSASAEKQRRTVPPGRVSESNGTELEDRSRLVETGTCVALVRTILNLDEFVTRE